MNPSAYITRYPARSDALSVLFTGMLGRPSARPLALRRPGFGVLVSVALGSRLPSYLTSASILAYAPPQSCITQARAYLGAHSSSLHIVIYHIRKLSIPSIYH